MWWDFLSSLKKCLNLSVCPSTAFGNGALNQSKNLSSLALPYVHPEHFNYNRTGKDQLTLPTSLLSKGKSEMEAVSEALTLPSALGPCA